MSSLVILTEKKKQWFLKFLKCFRQKQLKTSQQNVMLFAKLRPHSGDGLETSQIITGGLLDIHQYNILSL